MNQAEATAEQFPRIPEKYGWNSHPDFPQWGSARRAAEQEIIDQSKGKPFIDGGYVFPDGSLLLWEKAGWEMDKDHPEWVIPVCKYNVRTFPDAKKKSMDEAAKIAMQIGLPFLGARHLSDQDYRDNLTKQNIAYTERAIANTGTWYSLLHEITYRSPTSGQQVYGYVVDSQLDIDSWGQSVYVFAAPVPDETDWPRLIKQIDGNKED